MVIDPAASATMPATRMRISRLRAAGSFTANQSDNKERSETDPHPPRMNPHAPLDQAIAGLVG